MGSKCFRPVKQKNQPLYANIINLAMNEAESFYLQKKLTKNLVIEEIIRNQNRLGNLKKLFDHLSFHQRNVLPAVKECSKRISSDKNFSSVVIGSMFCSSLVKMIGNKKLKLSPSSAELNENNNLAPKRNLVMNDFGLKNLIYELESYFFQLIIKILVYTREKKIQISISKTLIKYSSACEQKINAKKELKNILDLYLTVILEKNIQMINDQSFLSFYAYSVLLSKSKSELFTGDFVEKHFGFILRVFFELEDAKVSSTSLIEWDDFDQFQDCVERIIKEFILFSFQNKKTKELIFSQIMIEANVQKFDPLKTMKLQKIIKQSLNHYNQEHFMFDWLGYLLKYIGKNVQNENESIRDSLIESIQEAPISKMLSNSMRNIVSTQSKANSIETLRRWFEQQLINTEKALQYFSTRIFEALLLNLYNPYSSNEQLNLKSQQVLNYILQRRPGGLAQIFILLSRQLRKLKNQYYINQYHNLINSHELIQSHNLINSRKLKSKNLTIIEEEAAQTLWKNDVVFLIKGLNIDVSVQLTIEEIEQIYSIVPRQTHPSINLLYLIQLAAISLKHAQMENQHVQSQVYNFLISLTNSMKIPDSEIETEYIIKLIQKVKFMSLELIKYQQIILLSFLKHCFKNLLKQNSQEVWTEILVVIIVVNLVIENSKNKDKKRMETLQSFLKQIIEIIKEQKFDTNAIYQVYVNNKSLFDISQRISAQFQNFKVKTLQHLESKTSVEIYPKSVTNMENSVLSSRAEVSESNPDIDFKNVCHIISKT